MKMSRSLFICLAVLTLLLGFIATSYATNGYFGHGYSVKNKALAGAGTALPLDSLAAAANPAGMVFVGNRLDVGLSIFNPVREYTVKGAPSGMMGTIGLLEGTVKSDSEWFVIPSFGFNWMMNNDYSLGISIYGNGGMNTDYDTATFFDPDGPTTGVDLMQLFVVPTYARKLNPKHAIGLSPIFAYQRFEARGLDAFGAFGFSSDPDNLSDNNHDNSLGFGGRIGYLGEIANGLFVGASYKTKIYMSEYDDYAGLFAEQGDFDIPASWSIGLAYHLPSPALTFAFDVEQILYGDIKAVNNPLLPNLMSADLLGSDGGAGFGWEDMTVYKIGIEWASNPGLTWRLGYSYGEQPIPDSEVLFNILAPGVIEQHITAGFTKTIGSNQQVSFAIMHAISNDIEGPNPLDPPAAQTVELKMQQWEYTAGYTWTF